MKLDVSSVRRLLKVFYKYSATAEDNTLISFVIEERLDFVRNYCNIRTIPEDMNTQILRMIMGEFLYQKYLLGGADALGIETIALITGWTEDDTTINFSDSGEKSADALILEHLNSLRHGDRVFLMRHRSVTQEINMDKTVPIPDRYVRTARKMVDLFNTGKMDIIVNVPIEDEHKVDKFKRVCFYKNIPCRLSNQDKQVSTKDEPAKALKTVHVITSLDYVGKIPAGAILEVSFGGVTKKYKQAGRAHVNDFRQEIPLEIYEEHAVHE